MFATKCPGQDMRYWTADDVHEEKCPQCGETIEFFKTDIRLRCRNCKTRVANPRFDMGCAQWCAHAEMCLGSSAKGLQKKSFRDILIEEFERLAVGLPEKDDIAKNMIKRAEERCKYHQADVLPVIAGVIIIALVKLNLINDAYNYLETLNEKHTFPQEVVDEIRTILEIFLESGLSENSSEEILEEIKDGKMVDIIAKLFDEYGKKLDQQD